MKIGKAIRKVMKQRGVTQVQMCYALGLRSQASISARLIRDMHVSNVIECLDILNYELVIQPKSTRGKRAVGAFVITNEDEGDEAK